MELRGLLGLELTSTHWRALAIIVSQTVDLPKNSPPPRTAGGRWRRRLRKTWWVILVLFELLLLVLQVLVLLRSFVAGSQSLAAGGIRVCLPRWMVVAVYQAFTEQKRRETT